MLMDRWGRQITYLRVSVTDRCNLRCAYCMPTDGITRVTHEEIMRYEEIAAVVRVAAQQGIRRVRLTGGEPLVRHDLPRLVGLIREIAEIEDISLTTNGILLAEMASDLKAAGLNRVNISLDTLNPDTFKRITRGGLLEASLRGIAAAEAAGLAPIKINAVAMRGVNEGDLPDLAKLTLQHPWHVRFIELMPVNNQGTWGEGFPPPETAFLPVSQIKAALAPLGLQPVRKPTGEPERHLEGPAQEFTLPDAPGRIGFISPVSEHFCGTCNRLRITADGHFRACLLRDEEVFFLPALRAGESVLPYLLQAVENKPGGHTLANQCLPARRWMQQIGG